MSVSKVCEISPSLGLRFTGVQKSHCFKSQLNIPSRITQSFSQILVISGWDEGKGEGGQAWDFRPISLHKALYTQQWHLHTVVKSTTKMETELFNAFLSVPIWGGQSTERSVWESTREPTWMDVSYQNISSGDLNLQRSWFPRGTQQRCTALKTVSFYKAAWPSKSNRQSAFWKCTVSQVLLKSD